MLRTWSLIAIAACAPLFGGTTFCMLNTAKPLDCTFSSIHHNRIAVQGGRVHKIICPENAIAVKLEEQSGQAFLQALTSPCDPVTVSVVTDTGEVQDLRIDFHEGKSEIILLHYPRSYLDPCEEVVSSFDDQLPTSCISTVIDYLSCRDIPPGYEYSPINSKPQRMGKGIYIRTTTRLHSAEETIFVRQICNRTRKSIQLSESRLTPAGCSWSYLTQPTLPPGKTATLLIAYPTVGSQP